MESIVNHYFFARDCKRGHSFRLKFQRTTNGLSWLKICRRCDTVKSVNGKWDAEGRWTTANAGEKGEGTTRSNVKASNLPPDQNIDIVEDQDIINEIVDDSSTVL